MNGVDEECGDGDHPIHCYVADRGGRGEVDDGRPGVFFSRKTSPMDEVFETATGASTVKD